MKITITKKLVLKSLNGDWRGARTWVKAQTLKSLLKDGYIEQRETPSVIPSIFAGHHPLVSPAWQYRVTNEGRRLLSSNTILNEIR